MGRKKAEETRPPSAPMWVLTFTDMISLLLTFFILMLTFSTNETEKMKKAIGSMSGRFGAITDIKVRERPDVAQEDKVFHRESDPRGQKDVAIRNDQVDQAMDKIQDPRIFDNRITVEDTIEGRRIRIRPAAGDELFLLGTDRPVDLTREVLEEVGKLFSSLPVRLVVEAHVDVVMGRLRRGQGAFDLTLSQSLAAAAILQASGMAPEFVGVSPRGDAVPVASSDTPEGRYENRRLEILVIPHDDDEILRRITRGL